MLPVRAKGGKCEKGPNAHSAASQLLSAVTTLAQALKDTSLSLTTTQSSNSIHEAACAASLEAGCTIAVESDSDRSSSLDEREVLLNRLRSLENLVKDSEQSIQQGLRSIRMELDGADRSLSMLQASREPYFSVANRLESGGVVGNDSLGGAGGNGGVGSTASIYEPMGRPIQRTSTASPVSTSPSGEPLKTATMQSTPFDDCFVGTGSHSGHERTHVFPQIQYGVKRYLGQFIDWDPSSVFDVDGGAYAAAVMTGFYGCPGYAEKHGAHGTGVGVNTSVEGNDDVIRSSSAEEGGGEPDRAGQGTQEVSAGVVESRQSAVVRNSLLGNAWIPSYFSRANASVANQTITDRTASVQSSGQSGVRGDGGSQRPLPSRLPPLQSGNDAPLNHSALLCRVVDDMVLNQLLHDGVSLTPPMFIELGHSPVFASPRKMQRQVMEQQQPQPLQQHCLRPKGGVAEGEQATEKAGDTLRELRLHKQYRSPFALSQLSLYDGAGVDDLLGDSKFSVPQEIRNVLLLRPLGGTCAEAHACPSTKCSRQILESDEENVVEEDEISWEELDTLPREMRVTSRFPETVRWLSSLLGGADLSGLVDELDRMQRVQSLQASSTDIPTLSQYRGSRFGDGASLTANEAVPMTSDAERNAGGQGRIASGPTEQQGHGSGEDRRTHGVVVLRTNPPVVASLRSATAALAAADGGATRQGMEGLSPEWTSPNAEGQRNTLDVGATEVAPHARTRRQQESAEAAFPHVLTPPPARTHNERDAAPRAPLASPSLPLFSPDREGSTSKNTRGDASCNSSYKASSYVGGGRIVSAAVQQWKYDGSTLDFFIRLGSAMLLSDLVILSALQYAAHLVHCSDNMTTLLSLADSITHLSSVSLMIWRRTIEADVVFREASETPEVAEVLRRYAQQMVARKTAKVHQQHHQQQVQTQQNKGELARTLGLLDSKGTRNHDSDSATSEGSSFNYHSPQLLASYNMLQEALSYFLMAAGLTGRSGVKNDGTSAAAQELTTFLYLAAPFLLLYGTPSSSSVAGLGSCGTSQVHGTTDSGNLGDGRKESADADSTSDGCDEMPASIIPRVWAELICMDILEQVASLRRLQVLRTQTYITVKQRAAAMSATRSRGDHPSMVSGATQCPQNVRSGGAPTSLAYNNGLMTREPFNLPEQDGYALMNPVPRCENHLLRIVMPVSDVLLGQLSLFDNSDMLTVVPKAPPPQPLPVPCTAEGGRGSSAWTTPLWFLRQSRLLPQLAQRQQQDAAAESQSSIPSGSGGSAGFTSLPGILGPARGGVVLSGAGGSGRHDLMGLQEGPVGSSLFGAMRAPYMIRRTPQAMVYDEAQDPEPRTVVWNPTALALGMEQSRLQQQLSPQSFFQAGRISDSNIMASRAAVFPRVMGARGGTDGEGPDGGSGSGITGIANIGGGSVGANNTVSGNNNNKQHESSQHSALLLELPYVSAVLEGDSARRNIIPLRRDGQVASVSSRALLPMVDAPRRRYGIVVPCFSDRIKERLVSDGDITPLSSPLAVNIQHIKWNSPFRNAACYCPVTKRRCVDLSVCSDPQSTSYNPPKLLMCGHVLSHKAVVALSVSSTRGGPPSTSLRCPYCSTVSSIGDGLLTLRYLF